MSQINAQRNAKVQPTTGTNNSIHNAFNQSRFIPGPTKSYNITISNNPKVTNQRFDKSNWRNQNPNVQPNVNVPRNPVPGRNNNQNVQQRKTPSKADEKVSNILSRGDNRKLISSGRLNSEYYSVTSVYPFPNPHQNVYQQDYPSKKNFDQHLPEVMKISDRFDFSTCEVPDFGYNMCVINSKRSIVHDAMKDQSFHDNILNSMVIDLNANLIVAKNPPFPLIRRNVTSVEMTNGDLSFTNDIKTDRITDCNSIKFYRKEPGSIIKIFKINDRIYISPGRSLGKGDEKYYNTVFVPSFEKLSLDDSSSEIVKTIDPKGFKIVNTTSPGLLSRLFDTDKKHGCYCYVFALNIYEELAGCTLRIDVPNNITLLHVFDMRQNNENYVDKLTKVYGSEVDTRQRSFDEMKGTNNNIRMIEEINISEVNDHLHHGYDLSQKDSTEKDPRLLHGESVYIVCDDRVDRIYELWSGSYNWRNMIRNNSETFENVFNILCEGKDKLDYFRIFPYNKIAYEDKLKAIIIDQSEKHLENSFEKLKLICEEILAPNLINVFHESVKNRIIQYASEYPVRKIRYLKLLAYGEYDDKLFLYNQDTSIFVANLLRSIGQFIEVNNDDGSLDMMKSLKTSFESKTRMIDGDKFRTLVSQYKSERSIDAKNTWFKYMHKQVRTTGQRFLAGKTTCDIMRLIREADENIKYPGQML